MLELGPTTLIQIINFIVLLAVLKALLWKPLILVLEERKRHIKTQLEEAEAINEEARNLKADYEGKIAQAKAEAQKVIQGAMTQAERLKTQIQHEAREEAARIREQAERDVTTERAKALSEVKRYMADLAVSTASKVLQESLDRPTQDRLSSEFVKRIGEKYVN